jgi:hypothetical protein
MKRPALEDPTSSARPEVALSDIVGEANRFCKISAL